MRWLTNLGKENYKPSDFGVKTFTGRPKATEKHPIEELESWGMIGVYAYE